MVHDRIRREFYTVWAQERAQIRRQLQKGGRMAKQKKIKPLDGFSNVSDADVVSRCTNIQTNMNGNSHYPTPQVDLATFKTEIDKFSALIAQALDGSKKVIAEKHKQREVVIKNVKSLSRWYGFSDVTWRSLPTVTWRCFKPADFRLLQRRRRQLSLCRRRSARSTMAPIAGKS